MKLRFGGSECVLVVILSLSHVMNTVLSKGEIGMHIQADTADSEIKAVRNILSVEAAVRSSGGTDLQRGDPEPDPAHARTKRCVTGEDASPIELNCESSCSCFKIHKTKYEEAYNIICNQTQDHQQRPAILSSAVFASQGRPYVQLQVYVQVKDVAGLIITPGFVSRWTAYESSAMDIWRAGDVVLPQGPISKGPTDALDHRFAGMFIKDSRLNRLPEGVFAEIMEYGIDLQNVTMPVLNLYNLVYPETGKLRYMWLNEVTLGSIQGKAGSEGGHGEENCCSITLVNKRGKNGVSITNSSIGVIETNSLSFTSQRDAEFVLKGTEIGAVRQAGIKLTKNIVPIISNSTMSLDGEGSILKDDGISLTATGNKIILPKQIMRNWNCNDNHIQMNKFIIVQENSVSKSSDSNKLERVNMVSSSTHPNNTDSIQNYTTSPTASSLQGNNDRGHPQPSLLDDFIHPSCIELNTILNTVLETASESAAPPPVIISTIETNTTESLTSENSTAENWGSSSSNSTSSQHVQVHKGLAYLVLAGIGALLLIVLTLAAMLVCKRKANDDEDTYNVRDSGRDRRPSLMYMPGSSIYGNDTWPAPPAAV